MLFRTFVCREHVNKKLLKTAPLETLYLKDHGGYYVDTGLTQVSAKLRAVSQVQLMDLVSER